MIKHLACIMDGNRRWAHKNGLPSMLGHKEGIKAVERTADFCLKNNIPYLSLYTFSIENLKRSISEKQYIFGLLVSYFTDHEIQKFIKKDVRIVFIGDRSLFPADIIDTCTHIEKETAQGKKLTINLLFCYGARQEITDAVKKIAYAVQQGMVSPEHITEQLIASHLWLTNIPDPELIIRTGGGQRLSNFLLYHAAYSELYFTDTLWPDFTQAHLLDALNYLNTCQRNFGV
ncbi:MAG: polyprenyl diphosphate synthase [Candidatus Dependentiae bacterium]|nr:polyprenyl diphosphate synthase [Candidatus Dependentiae bacterium]